MKPYLFSTLAVTLTCSIALAQQMDPVGFDEAQSLPIEINAEGETRFEDGIAIANRNVSIEFGTTSIFSDRAKFDPRSRILTLDGNVRIYQEGELFLADAATYNLETKAIDATNLKGGSRPFYFTAESFETEADDFFRAKNAFITTHDSDKPDSRWRARTIRIYPDDRIIFSNVTWLVGNVPVMWFPYLYQSLDDSVAFSISPGYNTIYGAYLFTQYSFPLTDAIAATARVDLMADRGVGLGLDGNFAFGPSKRNKGYFRTYFIDDQDPSINEANQPRPPIDSSRYRVGGGGRFFLTDDLYAAGVLNILSDEKVLEDFFDADFRLDPQPDNVVALTQWNERFAATLLVRGQVNDFFSTTSRLPELSIDFTRQPLFESGVFYEGETSLGRLERNFAEGRRSPEYDATRFDTFHQFLYPMQVGGWLSLVPRAGFRFTYYDQTGFTEAVARDSQVDPVTGAVTTFPPRNVLRTFGSDTRTVFNLGLEASFKASQTWSNVQIPQLGLDGIRHTVQPYLNLSYVSDPSLDPEKILQFNRLIPSTQLNPIDFPQFTSIDAIDQWTIARLGVRQRLQTRRGDSTFTWFEIDSFADVNFENPYTDSDFSNFYNNLSFRPVPWTSLNIDSQIPAFDDGFTEVNTYINVMPTRDVSFSVGHRYLDSNPFFQDSSLLTFGLYLRLNEHWAFSMYEQYELDDSTLESQSYMIHRDLSSWTASLGAVFRDNGGNKEEVAVLFTLTLKDLPEFSLPLTMGDTGRDRGF